MLACSKCIHKKVCEFCKAMGFENVVRANDFDCKDFMPADDVEEVKRGEWIEGCAMSTEIELTGEPIKVYRCSRCGRYEFRKEPYCNCGAKMDGGNAE